MKAQRILQLAVLGLTLFYLPGTVAGQSSKVWTWGDNSGGQTNSPANLTNVVDLAAGRSFTLALRADRTVAGWGRGDYGQLNFPAGLSNVVAIAAGGEHGLALKTDGTVSAWGRNDYGQATVPAAATNVAGIAAGDFHSVIVRADGTVLAWGDNRRGQTYLASAAGNRVIAVAAGGSQTVALLSGHTVEAWGYNNYGAPYPPVGLSNIVAIAAGANNCAALKADGNVVIWGNHYDPSARVPAGSTNGIVRVVMGVQHGLMLRTNGLIVAWGANGFSQTNVPAAITNATLIAAGEAHSVAAAGNGLPWVAAQPEPTSAYVGTSASFSALAAGAGQLSFQWQHAGVPVAGATANTLWLTNVQVADGGDYSLVISNALGTGVSASATLTVLDSAPVILRPPQSMVVSRTLSNQFSVGFQGSLPVTFQWRRNGMDLAGGTGSALAIVNAQAALAGLYEVVLNNRLGSVTSSPAALEVPSLMAWNGPYPTSVLPFGLTNAVSMGCGYEHNVVLKADGRVISWGTYEMKTSSQPADLADVVSVAAGYNHDLALKADGTVVAWGSDYDYNSMQAGQARVPFGLSNVVAVSGGGWHSLALKGDGTVVGWGLQPSALDGLSNVVAISAGHLHSLFLKADGTVEARGANDYGQSSVPPGLSNVIAISAGFYSSMALLADGRVVGWGSAAGTGQGLSNVVSIAGGGALALLADGTVRWSVPPWNPSNVVAIASSGYQSLYLMADGANVSPFGLSGAWTAGNPFAVSFPTARGRQYFLEATESLNSPSWTSIIGVAGDGGVRTLVDPAIPAGARFYRVARQQSN